MHYGLTQKLLDRNDKELMIDAKNFTIITITSVVVHGCMLPWNFEVLVILQSMLVVVKGPLKVVFEEVNKSTQE